MAITKLIENPDGLGEKIDRYDLIAELASGGMATVYLGRLSGVGGFQRSFAIKRLHPHLATNADFVQMFFDEARLAALIRHPNVVPILEVGEGIDGYYLVMEYIEGDTLASLMSKASSRGQRVPLPVSLRIALDMLNGLDAAHELQDDHGTHIGLVHRDVSPQNVLVGTDGITRITDFGVARAASRLSDTRAGQLKGKLAYMSPEQASGVEDVDRRTDVFAAGVVLWEALAFKRLFKSKNEAMTLSRVLNEPIRSPRDFNPQVPEAIAQVCLKALDRNVERRFVSCAEFADALERASVTAGQLATARDVAEYVLDIVGTDVESQRVAVRQWMERRERSSTSLIPPSGHRHSLPPPPEYSSVTHSSIRPPLPPPPHLAGAAGPSFAPSSSAAPSSLTLVDASQVTQANKSVKLWPLWALLALAAGGVGFWFVSTSDDTAAGTAPPGVQAATPVATTPPPAALGPPAGRQEQELSGSDPEAKKAPQPDTGNKEAAEDDGAEDEKNQATDEKASEESDTASESNAAKRKGSRSHHRRTSRRVPKKSSQPTPAKPTAKKKQLPDLENPYQ